MRKIRHAQQERTTRGHKTFEAGSPHSTVCSKDEQGRWVGIGEWDGRETSRDDAAKGRATSRREGAVS